MPKLYRRPAVLGIAQVGATRLGAVMNIHDVDEYVDDPTGPSRIYELTMEADQSELPADTTTEELS